MNNTLYHAYDTQGNRETVNPLSGFLFLDIRQILAKHCPEVGDRVQIANKLYIRIN